MFNCLFKKSLKPFISYVEVHITDHCNLKCNHCSHFCNLIDEEIFIDLEQFKKDFDILSKKIYIKRIRIMGGEPLLNPDINLYLKAARNAFPEAVISVVTNGILLPKMKEDFWNTLKENKIIIDLTKYPILGNKFSELLDLIDDHNMQVGNVKLAKKFYESVNPKGDSDIRKSWTICGSKYAVNLWRSKLYPCQNCYRYYYNKKYGTNMDLPPEVDFYKLDGEEIVEQLNKLKKPFDACRFCLEQGIVHEWSNCESN